MTCEVRSVCLYGPAGCGKTTNAKRIADALGLIKVVEHEALLSLPHRARKLPPYGVLLICETPPGYTSFNTMHYDDAMKIVSLKGRK